MPEEDRPYLEQIEAFFVATIRKGLMLRSSDVEILRDWQARDVPVDVVRDGIVAGVRDFLSTAEPRQELPAVLKYYRTHVEKEFEAFQRAVDRGLILRDTSPGPSSDLLERAVELLKDCADRARDGTRKAVYEDAAARLGRTGSDEGAVDALESIDRFIFDALIETAPREVADRIRSNIEATVDDASARGLGSVAIEDVRTSETRDAVSREFDYAGLVNMLVDGAR